MKFTIIIFISIVIFSVSNTLFAQEEEEARGNIMIVTISERAYPEDGSNAEFDSLYQLLTEKVRNKNEYIIMRRNAEHL